MNQFLVLTSKGVEPLLAEELTELGAEQVKETPGGVICQGSINTGYKICLHSRLATRVLLELETGPLTSGDSLYQLAYKVNWEHHFPVHNTFAIDFYGTNHIIKNSQFGALRIKDAIVDQFANLGGQRPTVDKKSPSIKFVGRIRKQDVSLYLDLSGSALSQRGYRTEQGDAPLKEHVAVAMLKRSGLKKGQQTPLVDPFCGSGTIAIEFALMALSVAPGLQRKAWGFSNWLGHRKQVWNTLVEEAKAEVISAEEVDPFIFASDIDGKLLDKAERNAKRAGVGKVINFKRGDATQVSTPSTEPGVVVTNPPYGERLGSTPQLIHLYNLFGENLKNGFENWQLTALMTDASLASQLKLSKDKQYKLKNGSLDCILNRYPIVKEDKKVDISRSDFANRIKKNLKQLAKWVKAEGIEAYRVYDADMPEYNVAIDLYRDYAVVNEYAPPKTIDPHKARARLNHVFAVLPEALSLSPDNIVYKVREQKKGKNQYEKIASGSRKMVINEHGARLKINLFDYLDTGLFLDHRQTRQWVASMAKGKRFLNLFAYTGSVSVHAALHGAKSVTTVDMSKTYLRWAEDNFDLNGLRGKQYQFVQANCLEWLNNSQDKFDLIFIDPPTFSNSKRMEDSFDVQRDHVDMLSSALSLLSEGGQIVFTNNKRDFKIDKDALKAVGLNAQNHTDKTIPIDFKRNKKIHNSWLLTKVES